jgi:hypothetical protein
MKIQTRGREAHVIENIDYLVLTDDNGREWRISARQGGVDISADDAIAVYPAAANRIRVVG